MPDTEAGAADPEPDRTGSSPFGSTVSGVTTPAETLYRQCLRSGVATGAVTGAVTAGEAGIAARSPLAFAGYGAIIGALVSVVPAALGGFLIVDVIPRRHPHPCSVEAVEHDLGRLFCIVVGSLNAVFIVAVLAFTDDRSLIVRLLPSIAIANASVAFMLRRARTSIASAWSAV